MYSIYIVDDEQPTIRYLVDTIPWLEHGFEVMGFHTDPLAAISEIIEQRPDAVFTDLKMPELDGVELFKRCREAGVTAEFVMLSAFDAYDGVRDFFNLGGVDYILKPLDNDNAAMVLEKVSRRLAETHRQIPSVQFVPSQSQSFDELIQYVTVNFNKKHTLQSLSEKFNMNPTYICDLFSKQYDSSLVIFVTDLRMRTAARLITENEVPLKEIAVACGYYDYQHFTRIFKNHFGKTPTKFREGG